MDERNGNDLDVPAAGEGPPGTAEGVVPSDLRLVLALGSLLALVAVAVLGSTALIVGLGNDTSRLSDRQIEYAIAVDEAALNAKGMANDERGFLISGDPEFVRQLDVRTGRVRTALTTAARVASGAAESLAVSDAHVGFESWLHALNAEIAMYQAGRKQAAVTASLERTRPLRKTYEASLSEAQALGQGAIENATSSVSSSAKWAVGALIAYLAIALVIGLFITRWVVGSVVRPMRALEQDVAELQVTV